MCLPAITSLSLPLSPPSLLLLLSDALRLHSRLSPTWIFLNRKIHALNIAVNGRKIDHKCAQLSVSHLPYKLRGETELLISYRSIMALIVRKAPGSKPMLMRMQGEEGGFMNHLLRGCSIIRGCYFTNSCSSLKSMQVGTKCCFNNPFYTGNKD